MSKKSAQLYKTKTEKQLALACGITVKQLREGNITLKKAWEIRQATRNSAHQLFDEAKRQSDKAVKMMITSDMLFTREVRKQFGQKDIEINWATGEVKS